MTEALYQEQNGADSPLVLLLHGLNCNGAVWDPLVELLQQHGFATAVPDFPGHGRSAWASHYSLGNHAAAVAAALPRDRPIHIIGHSMGGAVGLLLASGAFGIQVGSVLAVSTKIDFSVKELERMGRLPRRQPFLTREDAVQRFLRVTGLAGLVEEDHRCVQAGLLEQPDATYLATDPAVVTVVSSSITSTLAGLTGSGVPLRLACGSEDAMVKIDSLRAWDKNAVLIDGLGHNAHLAADVMLDIFLAQHADTLRAEERC